MNHKSCPWFLKNKNVRHCQPSSSEKICCEIQISTQYSALAINMLWSCLTSSTRNDGLDHYPILCLHTQNNLGETGLNLWVDPTPEFFRLKTDKFEFYCCWKEAYTRIFNIAVRLPVPWHSWGYPILPDLRNCLFLVHLNSEHCSAKFVLSVSPNFREPFCAHLQCSSWFDHSHRSIVENSFSASSMTSWCPFRWSW